MDNTKKIIFIFNEEKKELKTFPKNYQELKNNFVKLYNQNEDFKYQFFYIQSKDKKEKEIKEEQDIFENQMTDLKYCSIPEIHVFRVKLTIINKQSDNDLDLNNVESCESIDNNEKNLDNSNNKKGET